MKQQTCDGAAVCKGALVVISMVLGIMIWEQRKMSGVAHESNV